MRCDPEPVGGMLSVEDEVWSCLPPMGLTSDGIAHGHSGHSFCALSG